MKVKQIDTHSIKQRLRDNDDKETLNFIKSLEDTLNRQQELTRLAISKLRSSILEDNIKQQAINDSTLEKHKY